jgi:hypothetical protein
MMMHPLSLVFNFCDASIIIGVEFLLPDKEKKAEILKDLNLEKTKEGHIEAMYYFRMYSSDVCWKRDVNLVQANLNRLDSKTAKLDALKENIRMRVKGCDLSGAHITWSHKHKQRSVTKLASHLKWIIE